MASGQPFSPEEILRGHTHRNDTTYFLFDEKLYGVNPPEQVVVTGSFRGWSTDLTEPKWQLKRRSEHLWWLPVPNPALKSIPVNVTFKFRLGDGTWLAPPKASPNLQGEDLVFLQGYIQPRLRAELRRPRTLWVALEGVERSLSPADYRLTDAKGREIKIASIMPNTATEALLLPAEDLDIRRIYWIEVPKAKLRTVCSFDGWWRELYSDKELGANVSADGSQTVFRVFSPRADMVRLYLYRGADDKTAYQTISMKKDPQGVWEAVVYQDLHGVYYDFTVHGPDEPGSLFYETRPEHVSDPYARVTVDGWGKGRVWRKTKPAAPLKGGVPPMQNVIAYEVHIQDFTDLLPVDPKLKGTIPAMTIPGLRNSKGEPVGFDHLTDLGVNVIHLMPVQEYLNWPDEDWIASFKDDPYMKENGINLENYDWGYRTTHAFAVESRFRARGSDYGAERDQFRDLVQAFHDKGIAVIIDIVPNHTAENIDKLDLCLNFNAFDRLYYYRTKDLEHIGEYGNEVKTENRPMVQRWLIDQCKHFIEEFGIDGFRIDLAGQVDQQTLIALRKAIGEDKIVYGEPWIASNDPDYEANPSWDWYKADSPITFFQDDARNAFKGPTANPQDKKKDRGYAGGDVAMRPRVIRGLTCTFPEETSPLSGINYLDIHDNWALADQFATKDWDGRFGVDEDRVKIAATLLYTSLGPVVNHGGTEFLRSKGVAVLKEVVKETKKGFKVYLHGKRDTYNMRTANQFIWENKGKTRKDKGSYCDYKGMYAFWRGLNRFRLSDTGKIFRQATAVSKDYYQFITPAEEHLLGYVVNEKVFVLVNVGETAGKFDNVTLPTGNWKLVANNDAFDHVGGVTDKTGLQTLGGGKALSISLPPASLRVWVKE